MGSPTNIENLPTGEILTASNGLCNITESFELSETCNRSQDANVAEAQNFVQLAKAPLQTIMTGPSIRGPHKIRSDILYEGTMFTPQSNQERIGRPPLRAALSSQANSLFNGVLPGRYVVPRTVTVFEDDATPSMEVTGPKLPVQNNVFAFWPFWTLFGVVIVAVSLVLLIGGSLKPLHGEVQLSSAPPSSELQTPTVSEMTPVLSRTAVLHSTSKQLGHQSKKTIEIGSLIVNCEDILGYGSHGTVVYKGFLHGRPLAVKRMLSQFVRSAERWVLILVNNFSNSESLTVIFIFEQRNSSIDSK